MLTPVDGSYFRVARTRQQAGASGEQKTSCLHLAILLEPALVAHSLWCGQEKRIMRKSEIQNPKVQIREPQNKPKLRRRL